MFNWKEGHSMIEELKKTYFDWITKSISLSKFKNFIEIETPFLDMHNDHINLLFIKGEKDYLLSDDGYILNELEILNLPVTSTNRRKEYFYKTLKIFGVNHNNDTNELYVQFKDLNQYPQRQQDLLQCIIHITDMLITAKTSSSSVFVNDVENFFIENGIPFSKGTGYHGKSGNTQTFDFTTPRLKNVKEKIINTVNSPASGNYMNVIFPFIDIAESHVKDDSLFYVIVNNTESIIPKNFESSLSNYDISLLEWKKKQEIKKELQIIS